MKKTIALGLALVCVMGLLAGCGRADTTADTAPADNSAGAAQTASAGEIPADSILLYLEGDEGCAALMEDMAAGRIPVACNVLYDEGGGRPMVDVTDAETVTELYHLLAQVTVAGPTQESVTDCYHHIVFTLQDGSSVGFSFEGDIWCCGSAADARAKVENTQALWRLVRELQDAS